MEEKDIIPVLCTDSNMFKGINRTLRVLISFFTQLVLSEKSGIFRSNKTTTIHAGEGPVRNIKWKGEFLAWANNIVSLAALIYSQLAEASGSLWETCSTSQMSSYFSYQLLVNTLAGVKLFVQLPKIRLFWQHENLQILLLWCDGKRFGGTILWHCSLLSVHTGQVISGHYCPKLFYF